MAWIILVDLREYNGHIIFLTDEDDNIAQFSTYEYAEDVAKKSHLCQSFPIRFIDLDE